MSAYAFASRVEDASEEAVVAEAVAVDDFESNTFAITTAGTTSPAIAATNVSYEHQATISATTLTAVVVPTMNMTNNGSSSVDGAQLEPICESFPDPREIRIVIELFENERYSPRLGFSSRGLLINDRGIYSNDDGSMSFSTLEEATEQLMSKGWSYLDEDWLVQDADFQQPVPLRQLHSGKLENDTLFGWLYTVDFGSFASTPGVPKKGLSHFVRRRKLTRTMVFDEASLCSNPRQSCRSCDLSSQTRMADVLIEQLFLALRGRYGAHVRPHKIAKMKTQLLNTLFGIPQNTFSAAFVERQLTEFVTAQQKGANRPFLAYSASSPEGRLLAQFYPPSERKAIVRALIRKHDLSFQLHCADPHCDSRCPFATHRCPNPGCAEVFCRKDWRAHDADCIYKEVPCELQCGVCVSRCGMQEHKATHCIMRPVPCPYARCGCKPPGLIFRDVEAHCNINHAYHLALSTTYYTSLLQQKEQLTQSLQALAAQEHAAQERQRQRGHMIPYI